MLGSNVPTVGGLPMGFKYADDWGCECIQIYITLSRRWDVPKLTQEEINKYKTAWQKSSVEKVVAHVPFLVNLASSDKEIRKKSIGRLTIENYRANIVRVSFLVLHPGSYGTSSRQDGIKRIIEALDVVSQKIDNSSTKILLETMAGQGTMIGSSFEEIASILEKLEKPEFFGVCFDTAHVFISGYDIRGYEGYEKVLGKFDEIIGFDKIKVIHLNDSKTNLGSKNDRHACIGEGQLGLQVFHAILRDPRFVNVPKILEIPERDKRSKDNLELLRRLQTNIDSIPEKHPRSEQLTLEVFKNDF